MRSRTELVTTQLEGSEFEEDTDFEDSEEDWQPAKDDSKNKSKIKSPSRPRKSTAGNKNGVKQRGRKPVKKSKKKPSSEEDEELTDEEVPAPPKKAKKTTAGPATDAAKSSSSSNVKQEPTTSAVPSPKPQPLQRKIVNILKSFPDKCGFLNLYIFKGDLKEGIINNTEVCLWRRDGSSLLQKYLRDTAATTENPQYTSSMVYSCWEDKRADEYLEVKVKCLEQAKQVRVELVNSSELEAKAVSEYDSYVAVHGVPPPRNNARKSGNIGYEEQEHEDAEEDYDDVEDEEEEEEEDEQLKQEE